MKLIYAESKFNLTLFWEYGVSGIFFSNLSTFPNTPDEATIQFIVDEGVLQEISFEVVEP